MFEKVLKITLINFKFSMDKEYVLIYLPCITIAWDNIGLV